MPTVLFAYSKQVLSGIVRLVLFCLTLWGLYLYVTGAWLAALVVVVPPTIHFWWLVARAYRETVADGSDFGEDDPGRGDPDRNGCKNGDRKSGDRNRDDFDWDDLNGNP